MVARAVRRFGVYLVDLDPTVGSEIRKRRPCVIVTPDEMNHALQTVIIAPMTSAQKAYPTRVGSQFAGKVGQIVLDQLRTVDRTRLLRDLGDLDHATASKVREVLLEMFA